MRNLYIFTRSFPFSDDEPFLDNQLSVLANFYQSIIIIPLMFSKENNKVLPANCFAYDPIIKTKSQLYWGGIFSIKSFPMYFWDITKNFIFFNFSKIKLALISFFFTNNIIHSKQLKKIISDSNEMDVFFFYWGKGFANLLPFISSIKTKKVVQFHGDDLYHYRHEGYIPIQEFIIKNADIVTCISNDGKRYLGKYYPKFDSKIIVNYLGTRDFGESKKSNDGIFRILSCSSVIPLKRVHLIFEAIQTIYFLNIEWTHIGDGVEFDELKKKVKLNKSDNKIILLGNLTNPEVISYYKNEMVDLFINVSEFEGLPVSIMEAISFNVPVIATNVGGSSEIVNPLTGILIGPNPTIVELAEAIVKAKNINLSPRKFWELNFNAERNCVKLFDSALS
ncbi:MAG: hypothetical protein CUR34_00835 [Sediminibacterium sp.]|nr:MAG: hypothetical protein CUR34_00835 [Sediminibacterium sp.] [Sediminibacterium sp. FEMGT703S]